MRVLVVFFCIAALLSGCSCAPKVPGTPLTAHPDGNVKPEKPDTDNGQQMAVPDESSRPGENNTSTTKKDSDAKNDGNVSDEEHKHTWQVNGGTPASCTNAGTARYKCSECGEEYTENVAAYGHDFAFSYEVKLTCLMSGYKVKKCTRCGLEEDYDFQPAQGHSYQMEGMSPADCVTDGGVYSICTKCGDEHYEVIPAYGHNFKFSHTCQSTCTDAGHDVYFCEECGTEWDDYTINDPQKPHTASTDWIPNYAAGCESTRHVHYCIFCGMELSETAQSHTGSSPCICGWTGSVG